MFQILLSPALMRGWMLCLLLFAGQTAAAPLERWVYCQHNLYVEKNVDEIEGILRRAAKVGYTHVLLADAKFAKLGDMDARYFRNLDRVKRLCEELKIEPVPAVFPVGYSESMLWHDPNLVEGLPVQDQPLMVRDGIARVIPDPDIRFPGGDFADLKKWSWHDPIVQLEKGAARVTDANGRHCRIVQKLQVKPFRQYHIRVRVKTEGFQGTPKVQVLAGGRSLNHNDLGVKGTQDWREHHVVFNSLDHEEVNIYFGSWDAKGGNLWWDDARIDEGAFVNLIRRPGAPLQVKTEDGRELKEGVDFETLRDPLMGSRPYNGVYDVWHEPPSLKTSLPDGTQLRASWHHAVTVHHGQAMICPSEPRTVELLRDQARRMHAAWGARSYMMSHDEIRVLNWCRACRERGLDAGELLADNVRTCIRLLREAAGPDVRIHVWSDMFDPHHNARDNYYLVRGNLSGSWEGLDPQVVIVPWYIGSREKSLKWFADRGHPQLIAGYYDAAPGRVAEWLESARPYPGVRGVMYTTWRRDYSDLEAFARAVGRFR